MTEESLRYKETTIYCFSMKLVLGVLTYSDYFSIMN